MKPSVAPMKCSTSTIGRLAAIAPRVANATDSMVAATISSSTPMPPRIVVLAMARIRSIQVRWSSRLAPATRSVKQLAQLREIGRRVGREPHHDDARHRQILQRGAGTEPWLEQARRFLRGIGPHLADAGKFARDLDGALDLALEILPGLRAEPGW